MTDKERELKSFNQCADALSLLDKRSILRVFHMLSIHFEVVESLASQSIRDYSHSENLEQESETSPTHLLDSKIDQKPTKSTGKRNTSTKKSKNGHNRNLTYLIDFDFNPQGVESLRDYFGNFVLKTNFEKNLVFVYYLQEILKIDGINPDHIYSCYREVGEKIPSLPQSLFDTKLHKGWIETANINDIKVARTGLNHVLRDLQRKND